MDALKPRRLVSATKGVSRECGNILGLYRDNGISNASNQSSITGYVWVSRENGNTFCTEVIYRIIFHYSLLRTSKLADL